MLPHLARPVALAAALLLLPLTAGCSSGASASGTAGSSQSSEGAEGAASAASKPQGVDDAGWRVSEEQFHGGRRIAGYADRVSALPGEKVTLFVSSPTRTYTVGAYRMTGTAKSGALRVWKSGKLTGGKQTATRTNSATRSVSAVWKPSLTVDTTGWSPGAYLFRLTATDGSASFVPLVVRSASTAGTVAISMSVLTWQAYNTWGGKSAYKDDEDGSFSGRSYAASFNRPYANGKGAGKFLSYENPVIQRAEKLGIPLSYVTAMDVATTPGLLDGALGFVSLGHDEYWTRSERQAVQSARDKGTNLAFLGANVSYWQTRLADRNRTLLIYKSRSADPVKGDKATVNFRDVGMPERLMTGQMYECYPASGQYTVLDPGFFLYAGTGASKGSTYDAVVSTEVDRAYPLPGTPKTLQVTAKSKTTCGNSTTWSTSSYYTVASGAGVFSTGTMGWILKGMATKAPPRTLKFVGKVTDNLLRAMAAGPMGTAHPAQPNLTQMGLGRSNTTGAA